MLANNAKVIEQRIVEACEKAERNRDEIRLIAVTKSVDSDKARPLIALGIHDFGENRAEQLLEKQEVLKDEKIIWHFIGRLQRRKVKDVINKIDYFHALDNERLAGEIQKRADKPIKCFVQVNVSEETTKQGVNLAETVAFVEQLAAYDKIEVVGLMTMAPYDGTPEFITTCFEQLAEKRNEIIALQLEHAPCKELSMGMTQDYPLAIKAGATSIRIGTAFFKD